MPILFRTLFITALVTANLGPAGASAFAVFQTQTAPDGDTAAASDRAQALVERLGLSDSQKDIVLNALTESIARRLDVLDRYGIDPGGARPDLSFGDMRRLRGEMQSIQKDLDQVLNPVLNKSQKKELKKIREENRENMRAQIRG